MNFVFISPHFPENYWNFCDRLRANGVNVLGIGDAPYETLPALLKSALTEYYRVDNMENYDEMLRAMGFFTFKYGRIDWVESNNEYWLEQDARLRTDFNITTGIKSAEIEKFKRKSMMKTYYQKAGIATARYHMVDDYEGCRKFIEEVGYPVVVKPDNGVGASDTHKLSSDEDLKKFLVQKTAHHPDVEYIMEEFVRAEVNSYDAIIDANGNPIFEAGNVSPMSIMDIVNTNGNSCYYIEKTLPDAMRDVGRRTVAAFGVKSRFVHLEFFVLNADQPALGKKGDILGLEVNMRPSGGFSADMFNFANSTDVYKIWADMVAYDRSTVSSEGREHFYCCFCGRRDGKNFAMDHAAIMAKYGDRIKMVQRIPKALSGAMADMMYLANMRTEEEKAAYYRDLLATK